MVMIDDPSRAYADLARRIKRLENASPLGYSSVSRGAVEILSQDGLIVEGSASVTGLLKGSGTLNWTGPANLNGKVSVGGNISATGTAEFGGKTTISGDADVSGKLNVTGDTRLRANTRIEGKATLEDDLTVTGNGRIKVGTGMTLTPQTLNGFAQIQAPAGLKIAGDNLQVDGFLAVSQRISASGRIFANGGLETTGPKNFVMRHPDDQTKVLRHGATESPVSGIEYWDSAVIGDSGVYEVRLPDYFESLAKPEGRTVFVTGNGFSPSWTKITAGRFTVSGEPKRSFSWLVKAERYGGDFDLISDYEENSGQ
ncbi:hypothetical protein D9V30_00045 [Mycetocola reblochoni]|uniref:Polymer-forming cytoskeletal protein n=1 Tax=Mycetocola reblochoni TaxID=331618 RepID=A0A3L6ZSM1_9MICO|nr:hypothetical protein [Mycetocola reblochoni]RLP70864.1 hypothetical protein D9V30_00045 [Mycetocola reblochoni]